jgi:hypothetical protein
MAVSVDTVYQKVLALANKEQRGYITPQEFNLFADQAQKEIFEQYFYDLNQFRRVPNNNTVYADMTNNLEEKISLFEKYDKDATVIYNSDSPTGTYGDIKLSEDFPDLYRLTMVRVDYQTEPRFRVAEEVQLTELNIYGESPLTAWSKKRPVYTRYGPDVLQDRLKVYPYPSSDNTIDEVKISYIRKPEKPNWGYVVVNNKALYNASTSSDFELHPAEESELVYRILAFAGIAIEKPQLTQIATGLEGAKVQQEKQ